MKVYIICLAMRMKTEYKWMPSNMQSIEFVFFVFKTYYTNELCT